MSTIESSRLREGAEDVVEGVIELRRAPFEQTSAPAEEERVTHECTAVAPDVRDVAVGMPWDFADRAVLSTPLEMFSLCQSAGLSRNTLVFVIVDTSPDLKLVEVPIEVRI
jgi:hypothetical protein